MSRRPGWRERHGRSEPDRPWSRARASTRPRPSWAPARAAGSGDIRTKLGPARGPTSSTLRLQAKVQAERVLDVEHQGVGNNTQPIPESADCNRADLLGLGLGVATEAGGGGRQKDLERVEVLEVRGHRNHGNHAATKSERGLVGGVVARDHRRSTLVGLSSAYWFKVDQVDVPAADHVGSPSALVDSQASSSPDADHSAQAASYVPASSAVWRRRTARWTAADREASPCSRAYSSRNSTSSPGRLTLTFILHILPWVGGR